MGFSKYELLAPELPFRLRKFASLKRSRFPSKRGNVMSFLKNPYATGARLVVGDAQLYLRE